MLGILKKLLRSSDNVAPKVKDPSLYPLFVFAKIYDPVGPLERESKYEVPLSKVLEADKLGEISGGGTMQDKEGKILWVGVDINVADFSRSLPVIRRTLKSLGAPKGSELEYRMEGEAVIAPLWEEA